MGSGIARFVLLGPMRQAWPEPLEQLVKGGWVIISQASSVYEAAAQVADDAGAEVRGLLIDPVVLAMRDVEALALMTRHLPVAMLLLPHSELLTVRGRNLMRYGALGWNDAAVALGGTLAKEEAGEAVIEADNASVRGEEGKLLTLSPAVRYDEAQALPIVTEEEMQALLGT